MQPILLQRNAVGPTPWARVNAFQKNFKVGLSVTLWQGGNLTYTVQHTFSNLQPEQFHPVSISQTLTTITVTDSGVNGLGHGLVAGDYVKLQSTGDLTIDGEYTVATTPSDTTYTLTSAVSQSATGGPYSLALGARVFPHASLAAQTARASGSYDFPVSAVRLNITAYTAGRAQLEVIQGL
ncbi:MAG TPA: hypothetical protein VIY48_03455 [Candidatus Paceibacterota bacterium]